MANDLKVNPLYLDTFSADVTISEHPIKVKAISFQATTADDILVLTNKGGVVNVHIQVPVAKDTKFLSFGDGVVFDGLKYDETASTIGSTAKLLIYS